MTLEFEKLTNDVNEMAAVAAGRQKTRELRASETRELLHTKATAWDEIDALVSAVAELEKGLKYYRPARPIDHDEPLNAAISAPSPPDLATIIATDGSQILPDRHAAFMYYLVNIGAIVYHHGESREPDVVAEPSLVYALDEDLSDEDQDIDAGAATLKRDLGEIGLVAKLAVKHPNMAAPVLGLLDQRLLYWPFGERHDAEKVADEWCQQMSAVHDSGALLAGYIDRPGKRSVVSLLRGLRSPAPEAIKELDRPRQGGDLADIHLFSAVLGPGERTRVFAEMSPVNTRFAEQDPGNEVAFFYYNPSRTKPDDGELRGPALARVDIPMWVARDPAAVAIVHGLIDSQCRVLADYPYVLARADEIAVVGYGDAGELDMMIDLAMQQHGVTSYMTSKLLSKSLARGGRTRLLTY